MMLSYIQNYLENQGLDALYIPKADKFQGEYIQSRDEILKYISGFSGSAGCAIITKNQAFLCVDSRYHIQARQEVNCNQWQVVDMHSTPLSQLIATHKIRKLSLNPWLVTVAMARKIELLCQIIPLSDDFFDQLWCDRPSKTKQEIYEWDHAYAGQSREHKIKHIQDLIQSPYILTRPEDICWLLNLRGQDVDFSPLIHAMGILPKAGPVHLYLDMDQIPQKLRDHLKDSVLFFPESDFEKALGVLDECAYDPSQTPYGLIIHCQKTMRITPIQNPISLPKARKNSIEQIGMKTAHQNDAIAVINTLYWLDTHTCLESVSEMDVAAFILTERQKQLLFVSPSFETIAGSGPNGQIVHYRPQEKTNRYLKKEDAFLLIDSGGQYLNGTTDITRTISLGALTPGQKADFTWVLKGYIALASIKFAEGTTGGQLDVLARQYLWQQGKNYGHSTGHGVGTFLNVHEGPQRISQYGFDCALYPGMVISNEPGYYDGQFYGIRHENLELVIESEFPGFYAFETLTLVPFDMQAVDQSLLNVQEKQWITAYHEKIIRTLALLLRPEVHAWLQHYVRRLG